MVPALVLRRKSEESFSGEKKLSEASSCVSDGEQFVAASKRKPAVFLFVIFFFWPPKRKSKSIHRLFVKSNE